MKISYDTNNIFLKIERKNELLLYNYENKYNYNDIVSILKLPPEIYNESNKVVDVLDKAYENKKLILKFDEDNINMLLIVKLSIGFQEIDCPLQIRKKYYDINEIFNIILGELKSLKQIKKEFIVPQILELEQKIQSFVLSAFSLSLCLPCDAFRYFAISFATLFAKSTGFSGRMPSIRSACV